MIHLPAPIPRRHALALLAAAATGGCAALPSVPIAVPIGVPKAFAPAGRLRAVINLGNPVLARRESASGAVSGVSVDLANALAAWLGVPVDLWVVDAAAQSVALVQRGEADVGFFAVDPLRAKGIGFSAPYLLIEGAYLVRQDSPLRDNAEVDRPGIRVMVGRGSAYDLYLGRELRSAQLLRAPTSPTVVDEFLAQRADVAAGVRQQLETDAQRLPGLRLLPGRFMVIEQAMGVPAERGPAVQAALQDFVERSKASGLVAEALLRHGITGATAAPLSRG